MDLLSLRGFLPYGNHQCHCTVLFAKGLTVFCVPFSYALTTEDRISWLDVVFRDDSSTAGELYPRFQRTTAARGNRAPFAGWLLHDFTVTQSRPGRARGFRFALAPGDLRLGIDVRRRRDEFGEAKEIWNREDAANELEAAFWDPSDSSGEWAAESRLVADAILEAVAGTPKIMFDMDPQVFERLVAELIRRRGYGVELTCRGPDGGVDIFAIAALDGSRHIVQCKRYGRRVGVRFVRELYAVKAYTQASRAFLVTTSSFTGPAVEFARRSSHELELVDGNRLVDWITEARGRDA